MSGEVPQEVGLREIPIGSNGRSIIDQLMRPELHTSDALPPNELLRHFCRTGGTIANKPEACPAIGVCLVPGPALHFNEEVCAQCRRLFIENMAQSGDQLPAKVA